MSNHSRNHCTCLCLPADGFAGAADGGGVGVADTVPQLSAIRQRARELLPRMVAWRRDIHQHPELSGQELRTAALVAEHLRTLGMDVRTGVGGTGVVGLLEGDASGRVVALRADMDALPVLEDTGLPFASRVVQRNFGEDTPVAHACGHDGHTAILMGVAELLAGMRDRLPGSVKFIFQPAEEGRSEQPDHPAAPWGAKWMVADGALDDPRPEAIYGLHLTAMAPSGFLGWRSGTWWAGADGFRITVTGRQTHGSAPWSGVDPIVAAAQIVSGLQTIVSRRINITTDPAVVSVGAIHGGNRENIIPDRVEMLGTLRIFSEDARADVKARMASVAAAIAEAHGATAQLSFSGVTYPPLVNPADLTEASVPVLEAVAPGCVIEAPLVTASEDFADFQAVVPGFFFVLGAAPKDKAAAPNHSPKFDFDEDAMAVGAQALAALAVHRLST